MKYCKLYLVLAISVLSTACGEAENERNSGGNTASSDAAETDARQPEPRASEQIVLFLGNSLSAGYGIDSEMAFPSLIQKRIDSLGWGFRVVNAGVSGETSSGGLRRVDWLLRQPVRVLVLELGGNDGLRGIPVDVTRENLEQIITRTRDRYPDVEIVLAGMQIPPNLGHDYTRRFREIYLSLAESEDVHLIPFLLEDVGGVDSLMQGDGIHPTEEGHRVVAENVWDVLGPVLEDLRTET